MGAVAERSHPNFLPDPPLAPDPVSVTMPVCVLHTHSVAGCAVSMQKDGLLPLNQHALQVIGDVAYHDYEGTSRNPEERARFLANLGDRRIMVLRNHGLLIVGTSIAAIFVATYRMERAWAMQLAFQQSGAEFYPISDEVVSADRSATTTHSWLTTAPACAFAAGPE